MSDLTFDGAMQLFNAQTSEPFPVDFDQAWQWLGYSRKDHAKRGLLSCGFIEGVDLLPIKGESDNHAGLTPQEMAAAARLEQIRLTVDCFKQWGMMAGTEQGKQVRRYFLECERIAKMKAEAPNLQDVADPFWQLIDGAIARNIEPEQAIALHRQFNGTPAPVVQAPARVRTDKPKSLDNANRL